MRRAILIFAGCFCASFIGCNQAPTANTSGATATNSVPAKREVYHVKGVVKEFLSATRAKIAHEEVPNYMPAMTMGLDVKNTNEFAGIKVNDQIEFDMVVTDDDGWIEKIKKIGEAPAEVAITGDTKQGVNFKKTREARPVSEGEPMPDYSFVNEEGKAIRLSDFKGSALGFTFIFTRCPFPTFCPRMTANFEKASAELSKAGGPTNWNLLSITIDPEYDTPERLKAHAERFKRDPAKWSFVTGEREDIEAIAEQLGLIFMTRNGTIEHNLRTIIVDATGKVQRNYMGNEWDVNEFATEMKKAATVTP